MAASRIGHFAIVLGNGKVLVIGGGTAIAELFDPATNSFSFIGSTASASVQAATLLADGRVLLSGEHNSDSSAALPSEVYDPATGQFTRTGTMNTVRVGYITTLLPDGTVLLAGGYTFSSPPTPAPVASTEIYDTSTGAFTTGPTMRHARTWHTATPMPDGSVSPRGGLHSLLWFEPANCGC